ncbi:MAG: tetratricopeptide repeat protein, partial [Chloroflexi bacterium]|nr:tetratricopeptide repeat protein [Chloroflexota bacterium]
MNLATKFQTLEFLPTIQDIGQMAEGLYGCSDLSAVQVILESYPEFLGDEIMGLLKSRLDHFYQADLRQAQFVCQIMLQVADTTGVLRYRGEGLRGLANTLRYGGHFRESLPYFEQASLIYLDAGLPVEWARTQIGHIPALTNLGRYSESLNLAQRARTIFEEHHEPLRLATLLLNIAPIYSRLGRDQLALECLEQAREIYLSLGQEFALMACWADLNRSIVLRNMGDYRSSLAACDAAYIVPKRLGHHLTLARIDLSRAFTLFYLGRCNEALRLFDRARETFISLGNRRDAALIELYITDCLLQLNRYEEVVTRCDQIRQEFADLGASYEMAHSLANQGIAAAYLHRMDQAITALVEARRLFAQDQLEVWIGICDLYLARLHWLQGDAVLAKERALAASAGFRSAGLTPNRADADLVAAWAMADLGASKDAESMAIKALESAQLCDLPWVTYRGHHLLGHLARCAGHTFQAETQLKAAIADLESLRHSLMVEFRPDFLLGRESVYQELVELYLDQGQVSLAWSLAERGKSRALLDLLDQEIALLPRRVA